MSCNNAPSAKFFNSISDKFILLPVKTENTAVLTECIKVASSFTPISAILTITSSFSNKSLSIEITISSIILLLKFP